MKGLRRAFAWIVCLCAIGMMVMAVAQPNYDRKEDFAGEIKRVNYYSLNVRETPRGKVIGQLEMGDRVKLTGETCEYYFSCDELGSWVEIKYENGLAWVTTDSLR